MILGKKLNKGTTYIFLLLQDLDFHEESYSDRDNSLEGSSSIKRSSGSSFDQPAAKRVAASAHDFTLPHVETEIPGFDDLITSESKFIDASTVLKY